MLAYEIEINLIVSWIPHVLWIGPTCPSKTSFPFAISFWFNVSISSLSWNKNAYGYLKCTDQITRMMGMVQHQIRDSVTCSEFFSRLGSTTWTVLSVNIPPINLKHFLSGSTFFKVSITNLWGKINLELEHVWMTSLTVFYLCSFKSLSIS
jgi:hypothetical protein